jgi:hypothetical protein
MAQEVEDMRHHEFADGLADVDGRMRDLHATALDLGEGHQMSDAAGCMRDQLQRR